jgi:hypothetical protein
VDRGGSGGMPDAGMDRGGSGGTPDAGGAGGASGTGGTGGTGGAGGVADAGVDLGGTGGAHDAGVDSGQSGAADAGGNSLRDRFPPTRPATITATGVITTNDVACVMVGTASGCLAQNSPPCSPSGGQTTVSLTLTIDAQDNITVQAPYQDMCAPDYFCAITGPGSGCPIPTSYPVPLVNQLYLYDPRTTDRCRRDSSGTAIQVQHVVDVSTNNSTSVTIHQQCHTRMRNDGTTPTSFVDDTRDWTTVLTF